MEIREGRTVLDFLSMTIPAGVGQLLNEYTDFHFSIPASSHTEEFEGRQMKLCWIKYTHKKISPWNIFKIFIFG